MTIKRLCTHFELFARIFVFVSREVEATLSWKWIGPATQHLYENDSTILQPQSQVYGVRMLSNGCGFFCLPSFLLFVYLRYCGSTRKLTRVAWQCNRACRNLLHQLIAVFSTIVVYHKQRSNGGI